MGGRISNGSFCLLEDAPSSFRPPSSLRPRGFFLLRHSYFFYMPLSICSSNPPPSARTGHGAPLFNLTFSILSFSPPFLFRVIVLREKQPKQPFERRATICRQLSAIPLQSGYFSPVTSWRCLWPTIPRFALADLPRVVGEMAISFSTKEDF